MLASPEPQPLVCKEHDYGLSSSLWSSLSNKIWCLRAGWVIVLLQWSEYSSRDQHWAAPKAWEGAWTSM